jgi:hypothetical protein
MSGLIRVVTGGRSARPLAALPALSARCSARCRPSKWTALSNSAIAHFGKLR